MRVCHASRPFSSLSTTNFKSLSMFELNHLLQVCSNFKALHPGKQVHQQIIVRGLDNHPFMATKLVQMCADCNDIISVHNLFDKLSQPNVFAWTALVSLYSRNGMFSECLRTYKDMKFMGVLPDAYVFPKVLRSCSCLKEGAPVHKDVIVCGVDSNIQICNSLIDLYSKCGEIVNARRVFDKIKERDILSWNSMISGYVCNGFIELALKLFEAMKYNRFDPDSVTLNTIMDAYICMGHCNEACNIFGEIEDPNIISWTILISGYSRMGKHEQTLSIFRHMVSTGRVSPDLDCLSVVLVSCRYLKAVIIGQEIHARGLKLEKSRFDFYNSTGPALLTLYAGCKRIKDSRNVFELMEKSDVVAWNAMILGFSDLGMENFALDCFRTMKKSGIQHDTTTISTVLPVCDLNSGKQIHAHIVKTNFDSIIPILNALIQMYSKCGCIQTANSVFGHMKFRDLVSWNTMIAAFGFHGYGKSALKLLEDMKFSGLRPNSLTFTSLLSACSHSGLVDDGLGLFHSMTRDFGLNPEIQHFSCLVDLLARAGQLEEAVWMIKNMNIKPDKRVWGALLSSSRAFQNIELGILASEKLVELEPENAGNYVTLSNLYVRANRWDDAEKTRKTMERRGLIKPTGYSLI